MVSAECWHRWFQRRWRLDLCFLGGSLEIKVGDRHRVRQQELHLHSRAELSKVSRDLPKRINSAVTLNQLRGCVTTLPLFDFGLYR